jgi:hypothetical protein
MVANSAIKGFTDIVGGTSTATSTSDGTDSAQNATAGHRLYLTGLTFMDPFFGRPPPSWRVNKSTGYAELVASPRELFYHDLPANEADYGWVFQLTPQSLRSLFEGGEYSYAGWMDGPVWYIGTVEDRGLPVVLQRTQMGMAREMGLLCIQGAADKPFAFFEPTGGDGRNYAGGSRSVLGEVGGKYTDEERRKRQSDCASR